MAKIVVCGRIAPAAIARLARLGEVWVWARPDPMPRGRLMEWIRDADAALTLLAQTVDDELLAAAPRLRVVANVAVGYDNFDLEAATARRVLLTNTPDVLTMATADLTWALLLALLRKMVPAREAMLRGEWTHWSPDGFLGADLAGKTLGVVGYGRIGQAVGARAAAFGMRLVALGHRPPWQPPVVAPPEFFAQAEVISLHVPLTPETRGMVDERWLGRLRPGAYLINTSRGAVVDEDALLAALERGTLAGAALDVFAHEPVDPTHPLIRHPKVLATPHIGSATRETRLAMAHRAVDNVEAALSGRRPPDLLNPGAWLA